VEEERPFADIRVDAGDVVLIVCLDAAAAVAQPSRLDRAIVTEDAPITLLPDASRTPLRIAARGTSLVILAEEGDWIQVRFQDPQYGPRVGYVEKKYVSIQRAALNPVDLSVPPEAETSAPPISQSPTAPAPPQPAPEGATTIADHCVHSGELVVGQAASRVTDIQSRGEPALRADH
jgi:hypothetical protein